MTPLRKDIESREVLGRATRALVIHEKCATDAVNENCTKRPHLIQLSELTQWTMIIVSITKLFYTLSKIN